MVMDDDVHRINLQVVSPKPCPFRWCCLPMMQGVSLGGDPAGPVVAFLGLLDPPNDHHHPSWQIQQRVFF